MPRLVMYENVIWLHMHEILDEVKRELEKLYDSKGERLVITSAADSQHCIGTFHHIGEAFDHEKNIKITEMEINKILRKVELKFLPVMNIKFARTISFTKLFDLIEERTIWHIELDPK